MANTEERKAFANRLNIILDAANVPPKGKGRQKILGKPFRVSPKGAGKWLSGESLPTRARLVAIVELYKRTGVTVEWLLTGNPDYRPHCLNDDYIDGESHEDSLKIIKKYSVIPLVKFSELAMFINSTNKNKDFETMPTNEEVTANAFMVQIDGNEFTPYLNNEQIAIVEPTKNIDETQGSKVLAVINNKMTIMEHQRYETDYFFPLREGLNAIKLEDIANFQLVGFITRRITSQSG